MGSCCYCAWSCHSLLLAQNKDLVMLPYRCSSVTTILSNVLFIFVTIRLCTTQRTTSHYSYPACVVPYQFYSVKEERNRDELCPLTLRNYINFGSLLYIVLLVQLQNSNKQLIVVSAMKLTYFRIYSKYKQSFRLLCTGVWCFVYQL